MIASKALSQRLPRCSPKGKRNVRGVRAHAPPDDTCDRTDGMYEWGTAGAAGHQHTTPGQQSDGDQEAEQLLQGRWHDRKQAVLAVQQFATAQGKQAKVDTAQNGGSNVTLRCSSRLGNKGVLVSARYGFALWLESTIQLNL